MLGSEYWQFKMEKQLDFLIKKKGTGLFVFLTLLLKKYTMKFISDRTIILKSFIAALAIL